MADFDDIIGSAQAIIVPGVYDALSARIAARAGAKLLYLTGFGVAGAGFGVPDIGLVSASQMIERVDVIAAATAPVPLIADGDNGHGGPLNAAQLTRAYERAGAAAIQLEDQVSPKRCGHMENKEVVSTVEAVQKIRAAADARACKDFKIVARTDSRATHDLDEALKRGEAFLSAGADILFIEAPASREELRRIAETFAGVPLVANIVEDGKTPLLSAQEFGALGFKILLYPISALLAVTRRLETAYEQLLKGERKELDTNRATFNHYNAIMKLPELLAVTKALARTNYEE
ncbi:MAG TPA: isocitrate lyase/PEP mutase family protein [Rhizomicrobium sp.]|jgi:2-methylisocitrate lyase-like PEP mutase family enzyme|nr:isocitrate lyase/PEP mutase family protein [Rhizomicrobium sp.]